MKAENGSVGDFFEGTRIIFRQDFLENSPREEAVLEPWSMEVAGEPFAGTASASPEVGPEVGPEVDHVGGAAGAGGTGVPPPGPGGGIGEREGRRVCLSPDLLRLRRSLPSGGQGNRFARKDAFFLVPLPGVSTPGPGSDRSRGGVPCSPDPAEHGPIAWGGGFPSPPLAPGIGSSPGASRARLTLCLHSVQVFRRTHLGSHES